MNQADTTTENKNGINQCPYVDVIYASCVPTDPQTELKFPNGPAQLIEFDPQSLVEKKEVIIVAATTGVPLGYKINDKGDIVEVQNTSALEEGTVKD